MGHASITTTLDLYGHLYPGEMDRYADRLDQAATEGDAAKCGQTTAPVGQLRRENHSDLGFWWRADDRTR